MKIPKKYSHMVKTFEKDLELKGYIIILKKDFIFYDDTQSEYVETQKEINDLMFMVSKKIAQPKPITIQDDPRYTKRKANE